MMLTKTIRTPVKARTNEDGEPTGFTGYAAVFDNIDLGGDKIIKGGTTTPTTRSRTSA